jgi:hypothetical protein
VSSTHLRIKTIFSLLPANSSCLKHLGTDRTENAVPLLLPLLRSCLLVDIKWRWLSHWATAYQWTVAEPFPNNGCICWPHNFGYSRHATVWYRRCSISLHPNKNLMQINLVTSKVKQLDEATNRHVLFLLRCSLINFVEKYVGLKGSRDSIVGVGNGYGLYDRGVRIRVPVGSIIFSSTCRPDRPWGQPNQGLLSRG